MYVVQVFLEKFRKGIGYNFNIIFQEREKEWTIWWTTRFLRDEYLPVIEEIETRKSEI